jgi:hypothetical protein
MRKKTDKKGIEREIARLEKKHNEIERPICYTGNCSICNKINTLQEKIKVKK